MIRAEAVRPQEAIILAGGLGTRLRPVVEDRPKPLAPVAGQPFLALLLHRLRRQGIQRVVLSVGYKAEMIRETFGPNWGGLEIAYAVEDRPLGTGGGLMAALALIKGGWAYAMNGDTFFDVALEDLADLHAQTPNSGLVMALRQVADTGRYGRVLLDGSRVAGFQDGLAGPGWINGGVYLIERERMAGLSLPDAFSFERAVLEAQSSAGWIFGLPSEALFIDIGVPEDYHRAQTLLADYVPPPS